MVLEDLHIASLVAPLLRMKNGQYAKDGEFGRVSWDTAFDVMAQQFKRVLKEKGLTAVGMFGSGLRPEHPLQKVARNAGDAGGSRPMTFDEFAKFVAFDDRAYTARLSGVPETDCRRWPSCMQTRWSR